MSESSSILPDPKSKPKGLNPLLKTASATEVVAAQKKADEARVASESIDDRPQLLNLEKYLADIFEDARKYKEDETNIQADMLDGLRRRNGEYSQSKLRDIKAAGSAETYIPLTGVKCRTIEAFIHDIYLNAKRKRTWDLKPTPVVTIPDEDVKRIVEEVSAVIIESQNSEAETITPQQAYQMASDMRASIITRQHNIAQDRAKNMSRKVDDQLIEGGWEETITEVIGDLATLPGMIVKGPIFRERTVKKGWRDGKIEYGRETIPTFERVSPLDFYPSRFSKNPNDGTPMCEKVSIQRSSLVENREKAGYVKKNIEHIAMLDHVAPSQGSSAGLASEREEVEHRDNLETGAEKNRKQIGSTIEGIEHYCCVRGADLIEFGITLGPDGKKPIDALLDYEINAITVGGKIVFIEFNKDYLKRRPYSVAGFAKEIGGFWYKSPPQILKNIQDIINAAARAMVNNLSWSSGPQIVINDINRLAPGEDLTNIFVGKIWQGVSGGATPGAKLVEFWQPDSQSEKLMKVIRDFALLADQIIEMPAYTSNSDSVAGAGRTSSGLSMIMSSSNRGMKRVILDMDRNVFREVISRLVDYNLENIDDDSIKGDMNFSSDGVVAMMMREQLSDQRMKFLAATQNEFDMKVLGIDGRAKILADALETLESDYDDIAPTKEKIEKLLRSEEMLQQQQLRENEIKIREKEALVEREAAVAQAELQVKMEKLQVETRAQDLEFKNKERELDIRSQKQSNDHVLKLAEFEKEKAEKASAPAKPAKPAKPATPTTPTAPAKEPVNA